MQSWLLSRRAIIISIKFMLIKRAGRYWSKYLEQQHHQQVAREGGRVATIVMEKVPVSGKLIF